MTFKLRVGHEQVLNLQNYETLVSVVSQALGGSSQGSAPEEKGKEPKTAAEAHRIFNSLFR